VSSLFADLLSAGLAVLFLVAAVAAGALGLLRFLSPTGTDSDEKWLWDEEDS
jgi:hypothetical protein